MEENDVCDEKSKRINSFHHGSLEDPTADSLPEPVLKKSHIRS